MNPPSDPSGPASGPPRRRRPGRTRAVLVAAAVVAMALAMAVVAACSSGSSKAGSTTVLAGTSKVTIRLLAHDSFATSKGVLEDFTKQTGIKVELVQGGDAGSVVNQAILTKGVPQGDVLFGIDSTFLTRALDAGLFEPHTPAALSGVNASLLLDPQHRVTPVDYGDVCLNYDKKWFAAHGVTVPTSLEDLTKPAYKDLLVVENPATSSTGLAFLLSSVDHFGTTKWQAWWTALRANGVQVTDGWDQAYNGLFSGGVASKGTKPLVVSYASSPPAEVIDSPTPISESPVGVVQAGCYRQVEGAGVLRGTKHPKEAGELVDFMLSDRFQADVAPSMYVYPVRPGITLPEAFAKYSVIPTTVSSLPAAEIDAHRDAWIKQWTDLVVR